MSAAKKLKDRFLECPVCFEHFNQGERTPRLLLSCLHAFCTQCLEQLLKEGRGQIMCPVCRNVQKDVRDVEALPKDLVRNDLAEYLDATHIGGPPCSDCPDKQQATARCIECEENLCNDCLYAHKRNKATRYHGTMDFGELKDVDFNKMKTKKNCRNHPGRLIECYCWNCMELCCLVCSFIEHKEHEIKDLKESSQAQIRTMEVKMGEIGNIAKKVTSAKEKCKSFIETTVKAREESISEITEEFKKQLNFLERRRDVLVRQVREESDKFVATAREQSEQCEERLAVIESAEAYVMTVTHTDEVAVLQSYPSIMSTLVHIANEREIAVVSTKVEFEATNAVNVTGTINTYGSVNVIDEDVSILYEEDEWSDEYEVEILYQ